MRRTVLIFTILSSALTTAFVSCSGPNAKTGGDLVSNDSLVKRGNYLVATIGCDDCHSPKRLGPQGPEIDMENRLSGYPANRPVPKFDSNVVKKGMVVFNADLTSSAGPWG